MYSSRYYATVYAIPQDGARLPHLQVDLSEQVYSDELPREAEDAGWTPFDDVRSSDINDLQTRRLGRRKGHVEVLRGLVQPQGLRADRDIDLRVSCANKQAKECVQGK